MILNMGSLLLSPLGTTSGTLIERQFEYCLSGCSSTGGEEQDKFSCQLWMSRPPFLLLWSEDLFQYHPLAGCRYTHKTSPQLLPYNWYCSSWHRSQTIHVPDACWFRSSWCWPGWLAAPWCILLWGTSRKSSPEPASFASSTGCACGILASGTLWLLEWQMWW